MYIQRGLYIGDPFVNSCMSNGFEVIVDLLNRLFVDQKDYCYSEDTRQSDQPRVSDRSGADK